jgi:hypothetical protein
VRADDIQCQRELAEAIFSLAAGNFIGIADERGIFRFAVPIGGHVNCR